MLGPIGSPFEKQEVKATFKFPEQFPFKFPVVTFDANVWHPNINKEGEVCK